MALMDSKSQAMCQSLSTITSWNCHFHVEMGHLHICETFPHHPDITALNTSQNPALSDAVLLDRMVLCNSGFSLHFAEIVAKMTQE